MKTINKVSLLRHSSFALCLLLGAASAQDFGGTVTLDPKIAVVRYDFYFGGPPMGVAVLLGSLSTSPTPFQLPGIGLLELDLSSLTMIAVVPMSPVGKASYQLTLPLWIVNQGICFQSVFIDMAMNLRLTPALGFDALVELRETEPRIYAGSWNSKDCKYCFVIGPVNKGDNISISVNNQPIFAAKAKKSGRLQGCFVHAHPFRRGTVIAIYRNGKIWKRIVRR